MSKTSAIIMAIMLVIVLWGEDCIKSAQAQEATFYPGKIKLSADRSVISIEQNVYGLSFDTTVGLEEKGQYPDWMFLGDLKVDSVFFEDSRVALTDSTQLAGVEILSNSLVEIFKDAKVYKLLKMIPSFNVEDTLYWDSIRVRWHVLPDLSKYYEIRFRDELSIDSLTLILKTISGIDYALGREVPIQDNPCTLVVPNDPYYSAAWHLKERDTLTLNGGASVNCAWGLLYDYTLANIYVAIQGNGVLTQNHEDFEGKFVGGYGETTSSDLIGHEVAVAGIVGAVTNNNKGVAAAALNVYLISYDNGNGTDLENDLWNAIDSTPTGVINYSSHFFAWWNEVFDVLRHAKARSIPVVVSSGTLTSPYSPPPQTVYPAAWDSLVITVGYHGAPGNIVPYSNYPCDTCPMWLDVVAPGVAIPTTAEGGGYGNFSGSSAAAPIVAGIVALARGRNFSLTPEVLEEMLEQTADSGMDTMEAPEQAQGHGGANGNRFMERVINASSLSTAQSTSIDDSVPCLIITELSLKPSLQILADKKTKRGTNTAIEVIEGIEFLYNGNDLQEKIRACIKEYYDTKHLEYVVLAGDGAVVPYRYAYTNLSGPGVNAICDYYYACLDGDWNADSDTLWGEIEDNVDLEPEVAIGRLPYSTNQEFINFFAKMDEYEGGSFPYWYTRAAAIGSEMFYPTDAKGICQEILAQFPPGFQVTELYDDTVTSDNRDNYFNLMNAGQGIVIKYGMAQHSGNYCVKRHNPYTYIYNADVDALANYNMPSVIYAATCWNNKYDEDCMAEHYLKHTSGGAIAYIGTTYNDYVLISDEMAITFFNQLFGSGPKEIGKLLNLGKLELVDNSDWDGADRHTVFGYSLSGDPQMRIWTAQPQFMTDSCPMTLETGVRNFTVTVRGLGFPEPVEGALVCVSMGDEVYKLEYTDINGVAYFTNVYFPNAGYASVVASKHNYASVEDSIYIMQPTGCPMLYLDGGDGPVFINNILAASEDPTLDGQNVTEYYPIYDVPIEQNGELKIKISEDESEQTLLDEITVSVIPYPEDKRLAYTSRHEFRFLTGQYISPASAKDNNGNSILELLSSFDGKCFTAEAPGYIIVKYEIPSIFLKPSGDSPGGGIDPGGDDKNQWKMMAGATSNTYSSQNVTIAILNQYDSWETLDTRYPRINDYAYYTDLGKYSVDNSLTVRISWENKITIDAIPYHIFENDAVPSFSFPVYSVDHSISGEVGAFVANADQSEVLLSPGETISTELNQLPAQVGYKMAVLLKFVGRYNTIDASSYDGISFEQNYPNPFNPATNFAFSLNKPTHVELVIYNVLGQEVTTLADRYYPAGRHVVYWDGTNSNGKQVASGVYFSRFSAGDFQAQKKLIMLK